MKKVMVISDTSLLDKPLTESYELSLIIQYLHPGCLLECIGSCFQLIGTQIVDWCRVVTENGITGYVMKKDVKVVEENDKNKSKRKEQVMRIICFEFDGVIHSYKSGWFGIENIPDPPVEGIEEELAELKNYYDCKIIICSTRCSDPKGITAIWKWLINWKLAKYIDDVVCDKPLASAYVDNRSFYFDGNTESLARKVYEFAFKNN